jgi:O-antigen ligase
MPSTTSRRIPFLILLILLLSIILFGSAQPNEQSVISITTFIILLWSYWNNPFSVEPRAMIIIGAALLYLYMLCIPLPLGIHQLLIPEYAIFRTPILEHLGLDTFPLALRPSSHLQGINWIINLIFFSFLCTQHFNKASTFKKGCQFLILISTGYCLFGWLQRLGNADTIYWFSERPIFIRENFFGTFINPNHAGIFLAACLPLCFNLKGKYKILSSAIIISGILASGSRSAFLSMILGFFLFGILQRKRALHWFYYVFLLTAIGIATFIWWQLSQISIDDLDIHNFTAQRSYIWKDSWDTILLSPYFGTGIGGFVDAFQINKTLSYYQTTSHAHQEILETWVLFGFVVGTGIIVGFLYFVLHSFRILLNTKDARHYQWKLAAFCSFVVLFPACLVDFPFRIGSIALLFVFLASPFTQNLILPKTQHRYSRRGVIALMTCFVFGSGWNSIQQYSAQSIYSSSQYHSTTGNLHHSLYSTPLNVYTMQQYLQTEPNDLLLLSKNLTQYSSKNAYSWVLNARIEYQLNNHLKSCQAWKSALQLHFGEKNDPYIAEALGCSPQLYEAINAIPEDSSILSKAGFILAKSGAPRTGQYLLQQAATIDDLGIEKYARFLVGQKKYEAAWELIRERPITNCTLAKSKAQIGFVLDFIETPAFYQKTLQYCEHNDQLKRKLLISQLRHANNGAIKAVLKAHKPISMDPLMFDRLIHALTMEKRTDEACQYILKRYLQKKAKQFTAEDIKQCSYGLVPSRYPLQNGISGETTPYSSEPL